MKKLPVWQGVAGVLSASQIPAVHVPEGHPLAAPMQAAAGAGAGTGMNGNGIQNPGPDLQFSKCYVGYYQMEIKKAPFNEREKNLHVFSSFLASATIALWKNRTIVRNFVAKWILFAINMNFVNLLRQPLPIRHSRKIFWNPFSWATV